MVSGSRSAGSPMPSRNRSVRALRNSSSPPASRAAAMRSTCAAAAPPPSSRLMPTAPAAVTARTVAATSGAPDSTSAVTGSATAAAIRPTAPASSSSGSRSPSGRPRLQATAPLVVATATAPARSTMRAEAASQALGRTRTGPAVCRRRNSAASVMPASDHRPPTIPGGFRPSGVPPGPPVPLDQPVGLVRSPRPGLVRRDPLGVVGPVLDDRVDDPPALQDLVRADEQRRVADQRVQQQPLVRLRRLLGERLPVRELHRGGPDPEAVSRHLGPEPQRDPLVRLDPQHQRVR